MTKKDFDKFLDNQANSESEVDWSKQLSDWKDYLSQLHTKVEKILKEYIDDDKLSIRYVKRNLTEEHIGSYEANALIIELGRNIIRLEPIGTLLIGAKGRVDMNGPRGTVKLVLVPKKSVAPKVSVRVWIEGEASPPEEKVEPVREWDWKISTNPPRISYSELNDESFYESMMEVVNG